MASYTANKLLTRGLWSRGSPLAWQSSNQLTWKQRWQKSLPSYIGLELIVYLIAYYVIHIVYRLALNSEQKTQFEEVVSYFKAGADVLSRDLTFLLGFYVSLVAKRWWDQNTYTPWPDNIALLNTALTDYETEEGVKMSEDIMRYSLLAYVLCTRNLSKVMKKEFPGGLELEKSGLATSAELKALEVVGPLEVVWSIPLNWAMFRLKESRKSKVISSDHKELYSAINSLFNNLKNLECHDKVPIPAVYSQVVHLAVYLYFALAIIGNQEIREDPDIYFPVYLVLKFIFFVGWLKVARAIRNPFGDDHDDFSIGPLTSRHIWVCGHYLSQGIQGPPSAWTSAEQQDEDMRLVTLSMDKEEE